MKLILAKILLNYQLKLEEKAPDTQARRVCLMGSQDRIKMNKIVLAFRPGKPGTINKPSIFLLPLTITPNCLFGISLLRLPVIVTVQSLLTS